MLDLTSSWSGIGALLVFIIAYSFVITEEFTHLRKSKPVILAAGLIWVFVSIAYLGSGQEQLLHEAVVEYLAEYAELFLFLLAAMTYVNALSERRVFEALRSWLIARRMSFRQLFWATGVGRFFLSALIDNLTTALVMCAVVLAVGRNNARFAAIGCVNIVVAANAGGAFSPFGDITTLMVWQAGQVHFTEFLQLFLPSVVNYAVPAVFMAMAVKNDVQDAVGDTVRLQRGARRMILLFALTIVTAVSFHHFLHLPPFLGMMTGLAYLKLFGYYLARTDKQAASNATMDAGEVVPFDIFREVSRAEWDTLLFFFGVIMSVGGLSFIGYLGHLSGYFYLELGPTTANILVGIASAIVDNIPVMVAVLHMEPEMDLSQWLLVTLTAGCGGSLLSIGSAAGVALMGQARGIYTFFAHLRWTPVIAVGYALSIWVHLLLN